MVTKTNSKPFELLYETSLANKHLLGRVVSKRMTLYFKEAAKVLDLYKTYIEFLENENAFVNTGKSNVKKRVRKRKRGTGEESEA